MESTLAIHTVISPQLNLARKWRSKNFDQIIGQDLTIRALKNSLFIDHLFPVYLFSGQRGCGKTTTARVFTAAINCQNLENFRKEPRTFKLPCLECQSCLLMANGKHPDFIEIDAASHTGVDNVRNIIEAAALLPVVGRKRIYLIDEAHMLSKAAFNAFLKILEEPPKSTLFILATTDPGKIIETVRSRCLQLFFGAIESTALKTHLRQICVTEQICCDDGALDLIIKETDGCARDAINMLERVRFTGQKISENMVLLALGYPDVAQLEKIFEILLVQREIGLLLTQLDLVNLTRYAPDFIWKRLLHLVRDAWRIKFNLPVTGVSDNFKSVIVQVEIDQLVTLLEHFCAQEQLFMKSAYPHLFLELFLVGLVKKKDCSD